MGVTYEWDVETSAACDTGECEAGEVLDHFHVSSYKEARTVLARGCDEGERSDIVLVRDDGLERSWAYVENGKLPVAFTDSVGHRIAAVPDRFHKEVGAA